MMKGLLSYQIKSGNGAGIWHQVIDSTDKSNWPETSGSAMFTYATYGPADLLHLPRKQRQAEGDQRLVLPATQRR
jgi:rhamnogalacturonyl hydrolase YesR